MATRICRKEALKARYHSGDILYCPEINHLAAPMEGTAGLLRWTRHNAAAPCRIIRVAFRQ
jgi:hypothetical protein